jgi:hypothetical protein
MNELLDHLENGASYPFEQGELHHVLLITYNVIRRTVLDQCDTLILTPTHFIWSKDSHTYGQLSVTKGNPSVSFRTTLEEIIKRDSVVRRHLRLISETSESIMYRLSYDSE